MIERSKTDADGEGAEIAIPRGRSEATCPVVALQSWLAAAQIIAGPLFRNVNRGGKVEAVRLTADGVRQPLLKRANASRLSGRPIAPALASLGLQALADLQARMLSAGQRRRLALSRMVVSAAPLWLLDEPTLGVDTVNVAAFGAILAIHRAAGGVVVAATHLPLPEAAMLRLGEAA